MRRKFGLSKIFKKICVIENVKKKKFVLSKMFKKICVIENTIKKVCVIKKFVKAIFQESLKEIYFLTFFSETNLFIENISLLEQFYLLKSN